MNWKLFMAGCVSIFIISFPQNIIGCGPEIDPYDYYTLFFQQDLPDDKGFQPFYYSGNGFLRTEVETAEVTDILSDEWAAYCKAPVTSQDAKALVFEYDRKDLNKWYYQIEKNTAAILPDSVVHNLMSQYFKNNKDLEALGYVLYAKQVEPYVTSAYNSWDEALRRDSIKMDRLMKNGLQLYRAAKSDFIKLKYGYQVVRLAQYNQNYRMALSLYDSCISNNHTASVLQPLALSLKAGALHALGQQAQAAYLFSKAFKATNAKKVSNAISFNRVADGTEGFKNASLVYCQNNDEKANLLTLFALTNKTDDPFAAINSIFALQPDCEGLQTLVVKFINQLEERYLSVLLRTEMGGKTFYYGNYLDSNAINEGDRIKLKLKSYQERFHANASVPSKQAALFETAAAYIAFMARDYTTANEYLASAAKMPSSVKLKDQLQLTKLLVTINQQDLLNDSFEKTLLPSLQWLHQKVASEKVIPNDYDQQYPWHKTYRNLLSEILGKRYHQQNDHAREALAVGMADSLVKGTNNFYYGEEGPGVNFMRDHLSEKDIAALHQIYMHPQPNRLDQYLISNNAISITDVTDFAGTAFLRAYEFDKAIEWFSKSKNDKKNTIYVNPFKELLYDQTEPSAEDAKRSTSKLAFAKEMKRLTEAVTTDPANAAKHYYKIATGLYNMTYYGYAPWLVVYFRSSSDGYHLPKNANDFQKEYYGCYRAQAYFEKAMQASTDPNFKAKCLFMMAKCSQKQVQAPNYFDYNYDWDQYELAQKAYYKKFMRNQYFPQFIQQYSNTEFYKEAYNSCSYLRDFVQH